MNADLIKKAIDDDKRKEWKILVRSGLKNMEVQKIEFFKLKRSESLRNNIMQDKGGPGLTFNFSRRGQFKYEPGQAYVTFQDTMSASKELSRRNTTLDFQRMSREDTEIASSSLLLLPFVLKNYNWLVLKRSNVPVLISFQPFFLITSNKNFEKLPRVLAESDDYPSSKVFRLDLSNANPMANDIPVNVDKKVFATIQTIWNGIKTISLALDDNDQLSVNTYLPSNFLNLSKCVLLCIQVWTLNAFSKHSGHDVSCVCYCFDEETFVLKKKLENSNPTWPNNETWLDADLNDFLLFLKKISTFSEDDQCGKASNTTSNIDTPTEESIMSCSDCMSEDLGEPCLLENQTIWKCSGPTSDKTEKNNKLGRKLLKFSNLLAPLHVYSY